MEFNLRQAESFLKWFSEDLTVTLQIFAEAKGAQHLPGHRHGSFEDLTPWVCRANEAGCGVFFMVNEGDGGGRSSSNVVRVRSLVLDLDNAPLQPVYEAAVEPHLIVESSPHRFQVYYLVEDCPLTRFAELQTALALRFGGDVSPKDLARVMRVPGFYHQKQAPFLCHLIHESGAKPYRVQELTEGLGLEQGGGYHNGIVNGAGQGALPRLFEAPIVSGHRHNALVHYAAKYAHLGLESHELRAILTGINAIGCVPPQPQSEVDSIASWAAKAIPREAPTAGFVEEEKSPPLPAPGKQKIVVTNLVEFLVKEHPPREHIIGPFVRQGIGMVYAPAGVGKTHFCLGLAFAAATGGSFLRWEAERVSPVLYIDGELPAYILQERLGRMLRSSGISGAIPFNIITPDEQEDGIMPDLSTGQGQEAVMPAIERAEFIVLDNISTLCRTGKENEAESWIPVQSWALRLRKAGKCVVFVHHAGKGEGASPRGTSKREDVMDVIIGLNRPAGYEAEQGCVFEVAFRKARNFRTADEIRAFEARMDVGVDGCADWRCIPVNERNDRKIEELLNQGLTQRQIAQELAVSPQYVGQEIRRRGLEPNRAGRPKKGVLEVPDF